MENESVKREKLHALLRSYGKIAVAFSGGTDSSCLLQEAVSALNADNVAAFTVISAFTPSEEIMRAECIAKRIGVRHIEVEVDLFSSANIIENGPRRCYFCKRTIFSLLRQASRRNGFDILADGTNADDVTDYRPGLKALRELDVKSPLLEAGITKAEVRKFSLELPTANLPAYACLATRIPTGTRITQEALDRIENAEKALHDAGYLAVRIRAHGDIARLELPKESLEDFVTATSRDEITERIKAAGFKYVTLDLEGYRMGSMNNSVEESGSGE